MPKKPTPSRASDQVETELRRLILTLELEPGLAVSESTLMQRYGWGRTPLAGGFPASGGAVPACKSSHARESWSPP